MKNYKVLNLIILMIIIFAGIIFSYNISYAEELPLGDLNEYVREPTTSPDKFHEKVNNFITVIHVVGSIASVVALIIIGIRYMYSSVEEKAEYKKTMLGYIIGCALVFSIVNILGVVYDVATSF